jgi:hypothetical protein
MSHSDVGSVLTRNTRGCRLTKNVSRHLNRHGMAIPS